MSRETKSRPAEQSGAALAVQESTGPAVNSTGPVLALPGVVDVSRLEPAERAFTSRIEAEVGAGRGGSS